MWKHFKTDPLWVYFAAISQLASQWDHMGLSKCQFSPFNQLASSVWRPYISYLFGNLMTNGIIVEYLNNSSATPAISASSFWRPYASYIFGRLMTNGIMWYYPKQTKSNQTKTKQKQITRNKTILNQIKLNKTKSKIYRSNPMTIVIFGVYMNTSSATQAISIQNKTNQTKPKQTKENKNI